MSTRPTLCCNCHKTTHGEYFTICRECCDELASLHALYNSVAGPIRQLRQMNALEAATKALQWAATRRLQKGKRR